MPNGGNNAQLVSLENEEVVQSHLEGAPVDETKLRFGKKLHGAPNLETVVLVDAHAVNQANSAQKSQNVVYPRRRNCDDDPSAGVEEPMAHIRELCLSIARYVLEHRKHCDHIALEWWQRIGKVTGIEGPAGTLHGRIENGVDAIALIDQIGPPIEHDAIGTAHVNHSVAMAHKFLRLRDSNAA